MRVNATFEKFGWPVTKIAELDHWAVMLRPAAYSYMAACMSGRE